MLGVRNTDLHMVYYQFLLELLLNDVHHGFRTEGSMLQKVTQLAQRVRLTSNGTKEHVL